VEFHGAPFLTHTSILSTIAEEDWVSQAMERQAMAIESAERFPVGHAISLAQLSKDPYPSYRRLRANEPVSWCKASGMYLVTRYDDVTAILRDTENYIAGTDHSLIMDTFGQQMLTTEGELHDRYKKPLLPLFRPAAVTERLEQEIQDHVTLLLQGLDHNGIVDIRHHFAGRLPILTMLSLFGLPLEDEPLLRGWYDAFEKALSNFTWNDAIRKTAHDRVAEFHGYLQSRIEAKRHAPDTSLLSLMLASEEPQPLTDEEIRRNASIIFFGGISTVEALLLNSLYVLTGRNDLRERLRRCPNDMPAFLDEVVRWSGPVQSATRHVVNPVALHGVTLQPGDTVNCMVAAANHDPEVFEDPERFDLDRPNLRRHLGFAVGMHHCLGSHLAKLEARVALQQLLEKMPGMRRAPGCDVRMSGYEFRQPARFLLHPE
jgi:cytochrome P450